MTKLTSNPQVLVETLPQDHSLVISTKEAVIIKCTRCGGMKDCSLHDDPTKEELLPGGKLRTGITEYPWLRQCQCDHPAGSSFYTMLADVSKAMEEVKRVMQLLSREGH